MTKKELIEAISDYPDTCEMKLLEVSFRDYHYKAIPKELDTIKRDKGTIYLEFKG